jgi:hypothetical protein
MVKKRSSTDSEPYAKPIKRSSPNEQEFAQTRLPMNMQQRPMNGNG